MKFSVFQGWATVTLVAVSLLSGASPSHAAAKQYVVIVAEGLSPQVLELGQSYLRKSNDDPEESTSFDALTAAGKSATVGDDALSQMQGILESAENSGYKTGLVTTGDLTTIAPLFYTLNGDITTALTSPDAKYDFLAGGGRAKLSADASAKIKAAGGTYLTNVEGLDSEIQGRVLAPQADGELNYSIDRDPGEQAGLSELSTLAMDTLGAGDTPFVLVIHDTLLKKALDNKDSPALLEQFRELDAVVADATARREPNPNLNLAVLMTGSAATPRFTTNNESEQRNALLALSNTSLSFAGAARALKGADTNAIAAFTDPIDGQYKGWKAGADVREGIAAGTLDPETALRAWYEPLFKIDYNGPVGAPSAVTLGFSAPDGLVAALKAAVATLAK